MRVHMCGRVHVCTCVWVYVGVLWLMEGGGNINEWQTKITKPLSRHSCVYLDLVSVFFMLFQNIHTVQLEAIFASPGHWAEQKEKVTAETRQPLYPKCVAMFG